jgi:hypothetical protein
VLAVQPTVPSYGGGGSAHSIRHSTAILRAVLTECAGQEHSRRRPLAEPLPLNGTAPCNTWNADVSVTEPGYEMMNSGDDGFCITYICPLPVIGAQVL